MLWQHTHTVVYRMGAEITPRVTEVCEADGKLWLRDNTGYFLNYDGHAFAGTYMGRIYPALTQEQTDFLEMISLELYPLFEDLTEAERETARYLRKQRLVDFVTPDSVIVLTEYGVAYIC